MCCDYLSVSLCLDHLWCDLLSCIDIYSNIDHSSAFSTYQHGRRMKVERFLTSNVAHVRMYRDMLALCSTARKRAAKARRLVVYDVRRHAMRTMHSLSHIKEGLACDLEDESFESAESENTSSPAHGAFNKTRPSRKLLHAGKLSEYCVLYESTCARAVGGCVSRAYACSLALTLYHRTAPTPVAVEGDNMYDEDGFFNANVEFSHGKATTHNRSPDLA